MSLLTARLAAKELGVGYSTLKQWIYKGAIRTTTTNGGHYRIAESEVERLLGNQGSRVRQTRQHKVSGEPVPISSRNQVRGIVEEVRIEGLLAQVRLRVGEQSLTAVITRDAAEELKLARGQTAFAIIKATEVMIARNS
jgi:molybdopterin-binding protein